MRLYRGTADALEGAIAWREPAQVADKKLLVFPPHVEPLECVPLRRVLVLGRARAAIAPEERADLLARQLFRPAHLRRVPGHRFRVAALAFAVPHMEIAGAPGL